MTALTHRVSARARRAAVVTTGVTATALAVAPLMAPATAHAATKLEKQQARHTSVYVQGDSLTVGTAAPLRRSLGHSVRSVKIDAQVGRFTSTGMSRLAHDRSAKRARVWVLALGTNDGPDAGYLAGQVRRSLRMAGSQRQVVWLTIKRPGRYDRVNRMLKQLDGKYSRLTVVDWAGEVRTHPGLVGGDGVHGTTTGYAVRARMIKQAALHLAQQPTPRG